MYQAYHDHEWGVPLHDDRMLFEMLNLEGAQAGLSLFKLKQGWRYRYGDSPQRTLLALRMRQRRTPRSKQSARDALDTVVAWPPDSAQGSTRAAF